MSDTVRSHWLVTGILLAAALSAITGVISYSHGLDVARGTGNAGLVSYLLPLVPDLMIAMSSLVLFVDSLLDAERPRPAMVALVVGVGWTVAQNVAAGWHQGWGGRTLDAGVPLAFVLTFELLLWLFRRFRKTQKAAGTGTADEQAQPVQPPTPMAALQLLMDSESERNLAFLLGVDRNRVLGWKRRLAASAESAAEDVRDDSPEPSVNGSGPDA